MSTLPPGYRLGPGEWPPDGSLPRYISILPADGWTPEKLQAWRKERGIDMEALVEKWRREGFGNGASGT